MPYQKKPIFVYNILGNKNSNFPVLAYFDPGFPATSAFSDNEMGK
jgi:hypothetical protein